MAAKKKKVVEWVGGLVTMPMRITGEGEPFHPEAVFWLDAEGMVLGHTLGRPGEVVGEACESLRSTSRDPMFGRPHAPTRVRVASQALAEALRAGTKGIEIVCAPTPEMDEFIASIQNGPLGDDERSYLSPGVDPQAVAAFFRAAAELYRATPWKTVPTDDNLLSVTIEKLGVTDAVISVIGQMGESFGLLMFDSVADFEAHLDAADAAALGELAEMPPHFAINFDHGADLSAAMRREIGEHRWEVADAQAFPWVMPVDADLLVRPPSARDYALAEALCLALPPVLEHEKALLDAWDCGEPFARTLLLTAHAGDVAVTVRALPVGSSAGLADDAPEVDFEAVLHMLAAGLVASEKRGPARAPAAKKKKPGKKRKQ